MPTGKDVECRAGLGLRSRRAVVWALIVALITAGLLGGLEGLLALAGVRPLVPRSTGYETFQGGSPLFVPESDPGGAAYLKTADIKLAFFNNQRFPAVKEEGTFRVFCLGGSTTYGHPYGDATSFCGWLRELAPATNSARRFEFINAGGISYASHRIVRLMDELVKRSPDLFIVYTGHNEFLEERTYRPARDLSAPLRELGALATRTRLFAAAKALQAISSAEGGESTIAGEVDTILDHSAGPSAYHRDDVLRARIVEEFRYNLNRMVDIARASGAQVILVVPAVNFLDCAPFKSEHAGGLGPAALRECEAQFKAGIEALARHEYEDALCAFDAAVALDDRYALYHYWRGRTLYALGRDAEAHEALAQAIEEDVCPLRAISPIRNAVRAIGRRRGVPVVDFESRAAVASPRGIAGASLFLDHVHPTIKAHGMIAHALLEELARTGIALPPDAGDTASIAAARERILSRVDSAAQAEALCTLARTLGWAGKLEEAYDLALQAFDAAPDDPRCAYQAGQACLQTGRPTEALVFLKKAVALEPLNGLARLKLGNALSELGHSAEAEEHYRALLSLSPEFAAPGHNNLANDLAARGALSEAIHHYQKAISLRPAYAEALSNLALAYGTAGRSGEAARCYERALALEPGSGAAHYNFGVLLVRGNDVDDAAPHLREAVKLMPDYAPARLALGEAFERLGEAEDALACYREAARLQPNYAEALDRLAHALVMRRNLDASGLNEALQCAEQAVTLTEGREPRYQRTLADVYAAAGRTAKKDRNRR